MKKTYHTENSSKIQKKIDTPGSFTNKTDHHDITEILLKVALKTITPLTL
jgi:hypothetical protein